MHLKVHSELQTLYMLTSALEQIHMCKSCQHKNLSVHFTMSPEPHAITNTEADQQF